MTNLELFGGPIMVGVMAAIMLCLFNQRVNFYHLCAVIAMAIWWELFLPILIVLFVAFLIVGGFVSQLPEREDADANRGKH
ncbi:hypothetical protein ACERK3_09540 [Phycisphaerales bacterium AB-hyl4]|uniref:Uncharacterized protein n=1 Tax=Natronomicrosphaera hydrolytica TaxID=3242702 RepID=A0ABV4U8D0_9BACT